MYNLKLEHEKIEKTTFSIRDTSLSGFNKSTTIMCSSTFLFSSVSFLIQRFRAKDPLVRHSFCHVDFSKKMPRVLHDEIARTQQN